MADLKELLSACLIICLKKLITLWLWRIKIRSEFIRDAMKLYIKERERIRVREQLKTGYLQMADINKKFAEMGVYEDYRDFVIYETRLSECE